MVPEAGLERTEAGLAPAGGGWFVLNAREARWNHRPGRGESLSFTGATDFEAETYFPQLGVNLFVLGPGEAIGLYHWEADQEDFLVLHGEALLIVEGRERPLRQWDFVHCPPETRHMIVGAGDGHCAVLAMGAREHVDENCNGGGVRRRRGRASSRGRRRGGDERRGARLRALSDVRADALSQRLATGSLLSLARAEPGGGG